jgi:hypothetical protein
MNVFYMSIKLYTELKSFFFSFELERKEKVLCADPILHRHLLVIKKPKRNRERERKLFFPN